MKINLKIDPANVTLDDLIMIEDLQSGKLQARQLKEFVSRFATDEAGNLLTEDLAQAVAGKLSLTELNEAFLAIGFSLKEMQANAIPLPKNGS